MYRSRSSAMSCEIVQKILFPLEHCMKVGHCAIAIPPADGKTSLKTLGLPSEHQSDYLLLMILLSDTILSQFFHTIVINLLACHAKTTITLLAYLAEKNVILGYILSFCSRLVTFWWPSGDLMVTSCVRCVAILSHISDPAARRRRH